MSRRSATIDEETADEQVKEPPAVLEEPKSAVDARERAREDTEEVRGQQWETQKASMTNPREHKVTTIFADAPEDGPPETLVFAAHDGGLTLYASSPEMRFSRDNATALQRELAKVWATL